MPIVIIAGAGDRVVFKRNSERLQVSIPGSTLHIVEGAGHMVHHFVPRKVVQAIATVAQARSGTFNSMHAVGDLPDVA